MTVYTIRNVVMTPRVYGYETSQVYRHSLLDSKGISNKFLVTKPFIQYYWWKRLEAMGFNLNNVIVLPHLFSDMSDRVHSFTVEEFEKTLPDYVVRAEHANGKTYLLTDGDYYIDTTVNQEGFVLAYQKRTSSLMTVETAVCTEGIFYVCDKEGNFKFLNKDGSVGLYGRLVDKQYEYKFPEDDTWYSDADLTLVYLKSVAQVGDIFINDNMQDQWLEIADWAESAGMRYISYLHYNHFYARANLEKYNVTLPNQFMVANEQIVNLLRSEYGVNPDYVLPIGVSVSQAPPVGISSSKFLLVGNLSDLKHVDMAVQAFTNMPEAQLDVYGSTQYEFSQVYPDIVAPDNVTFKGVVDSKLIPRSEYVGYISCSETEMFANALVESLAQGLLPILNAEPMCHAPILSSIGLDESCGFVSVEELEQCVRFVLGLTSIDRELLSKGILRFADLKFGHDKARESLFTALRLN